MFRLRIEALSALRGTVQELPLVGNANFVVFGAQFAGEGIERSRELQDSHGGFVDFRVSAAIQSCCLASPRMRSSTPSSLGLIARSGRFSSSSGSWDACSAAVEEAKYKIF